MTIFALKTTFQDQNWQTSSGRVYSQCLQDLGYITLILGAFIAGILIFGTFKKSRVAIFVWIILAPIDILGLFAIMIMWAITKVWIMVFLCLIGIVETVRAIYVAHKAREEITNEKTNENGSNLGREDIDVNNVA